MTAVTNFEDKVLTLAKVHLKEGDNAHFFCGTLFLECEERTSSKIFSDIMTHISSMVTVSRIGCEFAIDFV